MRNIKTTTAVFCCLMIYWLVGREDSLLAVTSAIICMQSSVGLSVSAGVNRLAGTGIGALWGMILRYLLADSPSMGINALIASAGVMLLICICIRIRQPDSIVMACIVFLAILVGDSGDSPFVYSVNRMLDTFVGIAIAILINRFLKKPALLNRKSPENSPGGSPPASEEEATECGGDESQQTQTNHNKQ